jgi:putative nucleotidyltransferase with HDIG domain
MIIERNLERKKLNKERNFLDNGSIMLKTIKALITALEAKDRYTSGHSQRVANWAKRMGEALGLTKEDLFTLHLSAILHDIGKIGMPDKILHKSGSLLKMEYRTAKEHTVIGSRIVAEIDELTEVASVIRHHHERYDGKGYPDGLQGDAIPLLARILAIVDAYEAIISQRTYRARQPSEIALEEIAMHSGRQFDPELVDIFVQVVQDEADKKLKQAVS